MAPYEMWAVNQLQVHHHCGYFGCELSYNTCGEETAKPDENMENLEQQGLACS